MSSPQRVRGIKILKAASSPLRLQILNQIFDKGALSYTELMSSIKMNPSRDAGRFAYHLKFLLKADLIEADVEKKKYCLTELGKMVINVADHIDRRALKTRELLVRTSRFALEEFDANKITNSLVREAKVPAELAQKIAKEAEKELLKSKTKYITAPLVREVVNAILIEKGLEEYRNKLTRLGLPVQEVAALIESKSEKPLNMIEIKETAGKAVLDEYVLLNVLPRDIADAHLSGTIHIDNLDSWVLTLEEVIHDLRFFLSKGVNLEKISSSYLSLPPPQDLQSALFIISAVLEQTNKEVCGMQTFAYFNVFLSPFVKGLQPTEIKETMRHFVEHTRQFAKTTLGLEFTIPDFLAKTPAIGINGKTEGAYSDFVEEAQLLASLIIDLFNEETIVKPSFNPTLVAKIRPQSFENARAKAILLKAHALACERSIPSFANLLGKNSDRSTFSGSGFLLRPDRTSDWEIDTLRTGSLGRVNINIPRSVRESNGDKEKLVQLLKEELELGIRAAEIKYQALKRHGKDLLPFLMQEANGDRYLRLENCSTNMNLAGLQEASEAFTDHNSDDPKTTEFAKELSREASEFVSKIGKKHGRRLSTCILPDKKASERLAKLDIEHYGIAKAKFSGTREHPFYSTARKSDAATAKTFSEAPEGAQEFSRLNVNSLYLVDLNEIKHEPDELLKLTEAFFRKDLAEVLAYNRRFAYCTNCKKSWFGTMQKCPSCGAIDSLTIIDQFSHV
jgi:anaerobic ribonucleoside-triphosphate reductase/predicted transcriptional regulator